LASIATLALGVGANTAIFSVVNSVLLRPLPYGHGERLVHVGYRILPSGPVETRFSVQDFLDYKGRNTTLEGLAEYHSMSFTLLGSGEPDRVKVGVVSADFFHELGVKPLFGRSFRPDDERPGAPPVLVLTNAYWRRRFGGDPGVLGRTFRLSGNPITVVGILPRLPQYPGEDDIYIPTSACSSRSSSFIIEDRGRRMLSLYGRLKQGVSLARAQTDLLAIARQIDREFPGTHSGKAEDEAPITSVRDELAGDVRTTLFLLLGTAGMVLLISCGNIANFWLARLVTKEREVSIRMALGSSRRQLVLQLLTESTILSSIGGALGLLLAFSGTDLLALLASELTSRPEEVHIDGVALLFTLVLSLLTGLVFGLIPIFYLSGNDLVHRLKEEGGAVSIGVRGGRLRSFLIVSQVAFSFVLLIGSGLTMRSIIKLRQTDTGFDPQNVLTMSIDLPRSRYGDEQSMIAQGVVGFFGSLMDRITSRPGVVSMAVATDMPLTGNLVSRSFQIEGRGRDLREEPRAEFHSVSHEYFKTLGIPLLKGRMFSRADREGAPRVVIINRSMAQKYWPDQEVIGRRVNNLLPAEEGSWTIIGVVGDVKQVGLDVDAGPAFYLSFWQVPNLRTRVLVRTAGNPERLRGEIRAAVRAIEPNQPVEELRPLADLFEVSMASSRIRAVLIGLFASLAFVMATLGLSGVIVSSVSQRRKEIGIRMALGAEEGRVVGLFLRQVMALVLGGISLGLICSLFLTRFLASLLFEIEPTDPVTFVAVTLSFVAVAALACLLPARSATRIDPMVIFRN
jgi:predicted permease